MLIEDLNFYSLLIPFMMVGLGLCVLAFHFYKRLPRYLITYAYALFLVGMSVFLHTILIKPVLMACMGFIYFIFFSSCALHVHAVHQRLRIRTYWGFVGSIILIACSGLFYFSVFHEHQTIRLFIIGISSTLIYLHRYPALYAQSKHASLNRYLIYLLLCIALLASLYSAVLAFIFEITQLISTYELIWAATQFLLINIDMLFLAIFIGCAIQDLIARLRQERNIDPLTGLLNRRGLKDYIGSFNKTSHMQHAVLLCDLDDFKQINDHYGHHVGDLVLQHVSDLLNRALNVNDKIVRIGGDEFLLILNHVDLDIAQQVRQRIHTMLQQFPLTYQGQKIPVSLSIGFSEFKKASTFQHAVIAADQMLYQAKSKHAHAANKQTA